jgi:hypothetical protein
MLADMCRLDQSLLGIRSYGPERLLWSRQFNQPSVSNLPEAAVVASRGLCSLGGQCTRLPLPPSLRKKLV